MGKSGLITRDGRDWKAGWEKATGIVEQRVSIWGNGAPKKAAEEILERAKELCPVDTGHLKNSGRVLRVGAGETNDGTAEGFGEPTGSYVRNRTSHTTYVISFNTARVLKMGKTKKRPEVYVDPDIPSGRRNISPREKAFQSLNGKFNYAIIVHEGGINREATKFLEQAYMEKREQVKQLLAHSLQKSFSSRGSF